jgi:hypothetical protein
MVGQGGSGGTNGFVPVNGADQVGGNGGPYGGGGGSGNAFLPTSIGGSGGSGAVRIIWPGTTRQFPSTNTGNL